MKKDSVLIGLLCPTLYDTTSRDEWKPGVSICRHEELLIKRFDLLYQPQSRKLMETVMDKVRAVSPETKVVPHEFRADNLANFEEVYAHLHDYCHAQTFNPDEEDYLINITHSSEIVRICLFLLAKTRKLPGRLIRACPPRQEGRGKSGEVHIIDLDISHYDRIALRLRREQEDEVSFLKSGIETRNAPFNDMIERIGHVAANSRDPILLTGPTGSGKSRLARKIHSLKRSRNQVGGNFVEVNCAALRNDQAMSTLFGHVRGALPGIPQERTGLLRKADGGMLFLDEVDALGADEQAMLLRALEEKRFLPLGADRETESDFRLICSTNRDLADSVRRGTFREDLLSRISLWTFHLPPLTERPEDIAPNLDFELEQHASRTGTHTSFREEARDAFLRFATAPETPWPGNLRDLNAAVTRMATLADDDRISLTDVERETGLLSQSWLRPPAPGDDSPLTGLLDGKKIAEIDRFDAAQLTEVVRVCRTAKSLSDAGRILFQASRKRRKSVNDADRLRKYLARFNLDWDAVHPAD